ncbi:diguanylate cyclase domain-containing protein [Ideonella livida]|uniref:Diguanylate cyclase n=1 Tax=Ideonella livida TaxID=2707176 RepID=A0A7C9TKR6_9BURK|nr:diguanylate cyclase [Ideonella livida]NDY93019.1 diguanylate cyclase [Ideonella livida]
MAVCALVGGLILGLAVSAVRGERARQQERMLAQMHSLNGLLEARVRDVLVRADLLLQTAVADAQQDPEAARRGALRAPWQNYRRLLPEMLLWQWRPSVRAPGQTLWSSQGDFPGPLPTPIGISSQGLYLAGPLPLQPTAASDPSPGAVATGGEPSAPWVLLLSRPLRQDDPASGWLTLALSVEAFDAGLSQVDLGDGGAATIRTADLALVYRQPLPPEGLSALGSRKVSAELQQALLAQPQQGAFTAPTAMDGVVRSNVYQRLPDFPLLLLVGVERRLAPGAWSGTELALVGVAGAAWLLAVISAVALFRRSRRELDAAWQHQQAIASSSADAIITKTLGGRITSWNRGAEAIFGYTEAQMVGQTLHRLYPEDLQAQEDHLLDRVRRGEPVQPFETERLRQDGQAVRVSVSISPLRDGDGELIGVAHIARDVTQQRRLEQELRELAFHDPLTRLPNRRLLMERLRQAQLHSRRRRQWAGLLFVDLDRFKGLKDRLGHEAGDEVLCQVARRLKDLLRDTDTVARLGGDEFVVVCQGLGGDLDAARQAAEQLRTKLQQALAEPHDLGQGRLHLGGASVGLRLFLGAEETPEQLLREGDAQMYLDKQGRRGAAA